MLFVWTVTHKLFFYCFQFLVFSKISSIETHTKCFNCFLKAHNKQLNQYCLNFFFFLPKKKVSKNGSGSSQVGLTRKKHGRVTGQPVFASSQKNRVQAKYFSVRIFWPVLPCLVWGGFLQLLDHLIVMCLLSINNKILSNNNNKGENGGFLTRDSPDPIKK